MPPGRYRSAVRPMKQALHATRAAKLLDASTSRGNSPKVSVVGRPLGSLMTEVITVVLLAVCSQRARVHRPCYRRLGHWQMNRVIALIRHLDLPHRCSLGVRVHFRGRGRRARSKPTVGRRNQLWSEVRQGQDADSASLLFAALGTSLAGLARTL